MTILGSFKNEYGERFDVGFNGKQAYFRSDDWLFGGKYWRRIDLGRYTFSNEELCAINDIIYGRYIGS